MFDKLKQIHQLKKMQDEFKREKLTFSDNGVSVTVNGSFEVEEIILNPALSIDEQQETLRHCLNKAREDIQKTLAQKMMASGMGF
jgi:DNA-binding protein YbaB